MGRGRLEELSLKSKGEGIEGYCKHLVFYSKNKLLGDFGPEICNIYFNMITLAAEWRTVAKL